jgi:hypothetical protein
VKRRLLPINAGAAPRFSADAISALRKRAKAAGYVVRKHGDRVLFTRFGASTEIESLAHADLLLGGGAS